MNEIDAIARRKGAAREDRASLNATAIVEVGCLALMIVAGLAAWLVGVCSKGHDYDEVLRAHSIWLSAQGLRPYSDFFEVHPPYFVLLSPIIRAVADPADGLRLLRFLAGLGNVLFLGGLVALGIKSLPDHTSRRWAWLAVGFVAFNPFILDDLVEFRIDGWGYAAIVWATYRFRGCFADVRRMFEFAATTAIAAALFAPKTVFVPPLIALFAMLIGFRSRREFVVMGLVYLTGVAVAASLFLAYLMANRIGLDRIILLLGRYHAVSNRHAGFGFGLLQTILNLRTPAFVTVAGFASWIIGCVQSRRRIDPFEPAVAFWLLLQAALVTYPYKQYYAPWFLFGSVFLPSLGPIFDAILGRLRVLIFAAACASSVFGSFQIARFWAETRVASSEIRLISWMNKVSGPEDRVVGSPPYHPIGRFDTFFLSFNTTDPGGFDSERIFEELPGLKPLVSADHYRAELEAHPPAVVVLKSPFFEVSYPSTQRRVLEEYLLRQGYRTVRFGGVWFALRPDRFESATRNGYLE